MKKLIILAIFAIVGCSSEDEGCHKCQAKFFDPETREEVIIPSDCNHTPPNENFVFVSHVHYIK